MSNHRAPTHDERWGDHVPWSLRYQVVLEKGDWTKFFSLLSSRLSSLFKHNEAGIRHHDHFLDLLSAESLGCFVTKKDAYDPYLQVQVFFSPEKIAKAMQESGNNDPLRIIIDRLEVLQSLLVLLPLHQKHNALPSVIRDIKRFAADTGVLLNVKGDPPTLVPLEEPLLQKEVLDKLLPRLEAKFSERAADSLTSRQCRSHLGIVMFILWLECDIEGARKAGCLLSPSNH